MQEVDRTQVIKANLISAASVVMHTCKPSRGRGRIEVEVSLGYIDRPWLKKTKSKQINKIRVNGSQDKDTQPNHITRTVVESCPPKNVHPLTPGTCI